MQTWNGSTTATWRDQPLPFVLATNGGTTMERLSVGGQKLVRVTVKWAIQATTVWAATALLRVTVNTYNGVSLVEQVAQDIPVLAGSSELLKGIMTCYMALNETNYINLTFQNLGPTFTLSAPNTLVDFAVAVEGDNDGPNTGGLWVPFNDIQKGIPQEGVQKRPVIKPWEPSDGCTTTGPPLPYVVQSKMKPDSDESDSDDSDSDYSSDTSDEVTRLLQEFKANRRARKEHDELHARGALAHMPRIPVDPIVFPPGFRKNPGPETKWSTPN